MTARSLSVMLVLLLLSLPCGAQVLPPPILWSTGFNGNTLQNNTGLADTHYVTIDSIGAATLGWAGTAPVYSGPVVSTRNDAWTAFNPSVTSQWVGPTNGRSNVAPGNYIYATTFNATGYTINSISGVFAADNSGRAYLNGLRAADAIGTASTGFNGSGNGSLGTVTTGFLPGVNTVYFVINNAGSSNNPTGFRTQLSLSATAVPELSGTGASVPGFLLLSIGLMVASRRRRAVAL